MSMEGPWSFSGHGPSFNQGIDAALTQNEKCIMLFPLKVIILISFVNETYMTGSFVRVSNLLA